MRRTDQAGLVRRIANRPQGHVLAFRSQDDRRALDRELSDPALAQAAADDDAFGPAPLLEFQEAANDARKLLGKGSRAGSQDTVLFQCRRGRPLTGAARRVVVPGAGAVRGVRGREPAARLRV